MVDRIIQLMESLEMGQGQFAKEIGIQPSSINHIINGRNKPSLEFVQKLQARFPNISTDWLIYGKLPMMKQISNAQSPSLFDNMEVNNNNIDSYAEKPVKNYDLETDKTVKKIDETEHNSSSNHNYRVTEREPEQRHTVYPQQYATIEQPAVKKQISKVIVFYTDGTYEEKL